MTPSDKETVKELKRQYGGKLKEKWLNVEDYMLLVECGKYQTGQVLGVKSYKGGNVPYYDYARLNDKHIFCDLNGNSLPYEVRLVYCVRFPKSSKCKAQAQEKPNNVSINKWIPVDDYVELWKNDTSVRNKIIVAQLNDEGLTKLIPCFFNGNGFLEASITRPISKFIDNVAKIVLQEESI